MPLESLYFREQAGTEETMVFPIFCDIMVTNDPLQFPFLWTVKLNRCPRSWCVKKANIIFPQWGKCNEMRLDRVTTVSELLILKKGNYHWELSCDWGCLPAEFLLILQSSCQRFTLLVFSDPPGVFDLTHWGVVWPFLIWLWWVPN